VRLFYLRNIGCLYLAERIIEQYSSDDNIAIIHENMITDHSNNILREANKNLWKIFYLEPRGLRSKEMSNKSPLHIVRFRTVQYFKHLGMVSFYRKIFYKNRLESIFLPYAFRDLDEEVLYRIAKKNLIKIYKYDEIVPLQKTYESYNYNKLNLKKVVKYFYYSKYLYMNLFDNRYYFDAHYTMFPGLIKSGSFHVERIVLPLEINKLNDDVIMYFRSPDLDPNHLTIDAESKIITSIIASNPHYSFYVKFHTSENPKIIELIKKIDGVKEVPEEIANNSGENALSKLRPSVVIGYYTSVLFFSTLYNIKCISLIRFLSNVDIMGYPIKVIDTFDKILTPTSIEEINKEIRNKEINMTILI
jgi:hypothetical protein